MGGFVACAWMAGRGQCRGPAAISCSLLRSTGRPARNHSQRADNNPFATESNLQVWRRAWQGDWALWQRVAGLLASGRHGLQRPRAAAAPPGAPEEARFAAAAVAAEALLEDAAHVLLGIGRDSSNDLYRHLCTMTQQRLGLKVRRPRQC